MEKGIKLCNSSILILIFSLFENSKIKRKKQSVYWHYFTAEDINMEWNIPVKPANNLSVFVETFCISCKVYFLVIKLMLLIFFLRFEFFYMGIKFHVFKFSGDFYLQI